MNSEKYFLYLAQYFMTIFISAQELEMSRGKDWKRDCNALENKYDQVLQKEISHRHLGSSRYPPIFLASPLKLFPSGCLPLQWSRPASRQCQDAPH